MDPTLIYAARLQKFITRVQFGHSNNLIKNMLLLFGSYIFVYNFCFSYPSLEFLSVVFLKNNYSLIY